MCNNKHKEKTINKKNFVFTDKIIYIISIIVVAFNLVGLAIFYFHHQEWIKSRDPIRNWVDYADSTGPLFQSAIAAATVLAAVWIATTVNDRIDARRKADEEAREERRKAEAQDHENRRKADERARELIRLSEKMFDTEFYTKITAPMWEIVYKWLHWKGEDGDRYRAEVLSGELDISGLKFNVPEKARGKIGNLIRFHPHYLPYDYGTENSPACPIHELSEHMVITTWIRFWVHLDLLVHEWRILSEEDVQKAFAGWYMCWAKFTGQYLACWEDCMKKRRMQITEQNVLWNLRRIHNTLTKQTSVQMPDGLLENVWKQVLKLAEGSAQSRLWAGNDTAGDAVKPT